MKITSSQIADILVSPFRIRLRTNSTTSSLVNEFQMPSHAKIMNSSSAVIVARFTSGIADIICSSAFRSLFCEMEKIENVSSPGPGNRYVCMALTVLYA